MKRYAAAFLAILMLFSCTVTACIKRPNGSATHAPEAHSSQAPSETDAGATPVQSALPTDPPQAPANTDAGATIAPAEKSEADIAFEELAYEVFRSTLLTDGLTFHQMCVDPASYDISEDEIERGWGEFSYEANQASYDENDELLESLSAIDESKLNEANRIAYENLAEAIELSNDLRDYYYYDEPLTPFNGMHTMLPLVMTMYKIDTAEDAENYLILLEDMPRYIGQIAAFETEKAAQGLFMTENALDQVIASCNKFVDEGSDCFLIGYFEGVLDDASFTLSASEKSALKERSRSCVLNEIMPAYRSLAAALEGLRGSCRPMEGACQRSAEELEYYRLQLRIDAGVNESAEEMGTLLGEYADKLLGKLIAVMMRDPSAANEFGGRITSGDPETDIAYLKKLIEKVYPAIPEQEIEYMTIPDALAEDFSPAAYLISAYDYPRRNLVMFNPTADDRTMLFTLAHECFPGHLYQTQYFRNSSIPLVQQAIAPSAYLEGWAVFSELTIAGMAGKYNASVCLMEQYNDILCNIIIPAYISIRINCDGWTSSDVRSYLVEFGLNDDDYVDILCEYSVDVPHYFFNYAMGFVNTYRIYENADPSTDAELLSFFEEYLGAGPCWFDILNEKFGVE